MFSPEIRVIRDRSVFGIETLRGGVEEVETFGRDAGNDLGRDSAPRERFTHAEETAGPRDRGEDGIGVEGLNGPQIDHLDLETFGAQSLRDR